MTKGSGPVRPGVRRPRLCPRGVFFGEDQENEASGRGIFESRAQISLRGSAVDYAYIEFQPSGGTSGNSTANIFSIVQGTAADQAPTQLGQLCAAGCGAAHRTREGGAPLNKAGS